MTINLPDNPAIYSNETIFESTHYKESPWWVARTKSRQEKALAWSLLASGVNYFLPLVSRPQNNKTRLRLSIVPLFPGYLFFRGTNQQRYQALTTGRIAQVIPVEDQTTLNKELHSISLICLTTENIELCDLVQEGRPGKILFGPFAGVEGIVQEKKSRTRLILAVQAIGQAVRLEINMDQVALLP